MDTSQKTAFRSKELKTIRLMIGIHCRKKHGTHQNLCGECCELLDYCQERLEHCPFGVQKPTCAKCPIHCYQPEFRERIRAVMRFAGPRMIWFHPVDALAHLFRSFKPSKPLNS